MLGVLSGLGAELLSAPAQALVSHGSARRARAMVAVTINGGVHATRAMVAGPIVGANVAVLGLDHAVQADDNCPTYCCWPLSSG